MLSTAARFVASRNYREDLLHHVASYAELAAVETTMLVQDTKQRVLWALAAVVLALVGFTLLGVAAMLLSTVGEGGLAAHPALWVVPTVALAGAALAALRSSLGTPGVPFAALRAQLAADMARVPADVAAPSASQVSS